MLHSCFSWSKVTESIYVGGEICCARHFSEFATKEGVSAVLSMEGEKCDCISDLKTHLWIPLVDRRIPDAAQLELGLGFISSNINLGNKIYVHCKYGMGRGPFMVIMHLIKSKGIPTREAIDFVREKRPILDLSEEQTKYLSGI